jgi:biopolymer transport protein ExbB/TolQ
MMILDTTSHARPGTGAEPPALFPRYFNAKILWNRDHRERSARVFRNILLGSVSKESVRADIEAAKLASERAAAIVHRKMGRGRASLAGIAGSAPLVGILGTVFGIAGSFRGVNGEKSAIMAALAQDLSQAIIPTAVSLLIAPWWCHAYLSSELETLDIEMRAASLDLANSLSLLRQRH